MTKEIIIDGVNVAECKYLSKVVNEEPYCNIDEEHLYTCSSDENCYYKQLKRLEQENAELKERLKNLDEEEVVYEVTETEYNNFKKYKQALEEIRGIAEIITPYGVEDKRYLDKILDKINEVLK